MKLLSINITDNTIYYLSCEIINKKITILKHSNFRLISDDGTKINLEEDNYNILKLRSKHGKYKFHQILELFILNKYDFYIFNYDGKNYKIYRFFRDLLPDENNVLVYSITNLLKKTRKYL